MSELYEESDVVETIFDSHSLSKSHTQSHDGAESQSQFHYDSTLSSQLQEHEVVVRRSGRRSTGAGTGTGPSSYGERQQDTGSAPKQDFYDLESSQRSFKDDDDMKDEEEKRESWLKKSNFLIRRIDFFTRLASVASAFPFIIVLSSMNMPGKTVFLRSITAVRIMNVLVYVLPVLFVKYVLQEYLDPTSQRCAIFFYTFLYLIPVGYVVLSKVRKSSSSSTIEEGTFCFKPGRQVHFNISNMFVLFGFGFEWIQHTLYCLPLGIVSGM